MTQEGLNAMTWLDVDRNCAIAELTCKVNSYSGSGVKETEQKYFDRV